MQASSDRQACAQILMCGHSLKAIEYKHYAKYSPFLSYPSHLSEEIRDQPKLRNLVCYILTKNALNTVLVNVYFPTSTADKEIRLN